jgi:hypothetical protein
MTPTGPSLDLSSAWQLRMLTLCNQKVIIISFIIYMYLLSHGHTCGVNML